MERADGWKERKEGKGKKDGKGERREGGGKEEGGQKGGRGRGGRNIPFFSHVCSIDALSNTVL